MLRANKKEVETIWPWRICMSKCLADCWIARGVGCPVKVARGGHQDDLLPWCGIISPNPTGHGPVQMVSGYNTFIMQFLSDSTLSFAPAFHVQGQRLGKHKFKLHKKFYLNGKCCMHLTFRDAIYSYHGGQIRGYWSSGPRVIVIRSHLCKPLLLALSLIRYLITLGRWG